MMTRSIGGNASPSMLDTKIPGLVENIEMPTSASLGAISTLTISANRLADSYGFELNVKYKEETILIPRKSLNIL